MNLKLCCIFYMLLFLVILFSHTCWLPSVSWNVTHEHCLQFTMHLLSWACENRSHAHTFLVGSYFWPWLSLQGNVEGEGLFLDLQCVCLNANFEQNIIWLFGFEMCTNFYISEMVFFNIFISFENQSAK